MLSGKAARPIVTEDRGHPLAAILPNYIPPTFDPVGDTWKYYRLRKKLQNFHKILCYYA